MSSKNYNRINEEDDEEEAVQASDIEHIINWQPVVYENAANLTPEAAAEGLARFRMRAGGDMSTDYRDGYRAWRLGRSSGATETSVGLLGCHPAARRDVAIELAENSATYPSLTPAERDTPRYWWRYTVSYWVSCTFMIGSVLFVVGSGFDFFDHSYVDLNPIRMSATVQWPYFAGGLFFLSGSYLGYFSAINLGRREDLPARYFLFVPPTYFCRLWRRAASRTSAESPPLWSPQGASAFLDIQPEAWHSFFGYTAYMFGAASFQLGILFDMLGMEDPDKLHIYTSWPAAVGGALFVTGAAFAVDVNESWRPSGALHDIAWWVSNANMIGSILFLQAGVFSIDGTMPNFVKLPYLIGSLLFLVGATLELFMWRVELHGLSFVRAINKVTKLAEVLREQQHTSIETTSAATNNSSISLNQLFFVQIVILTYAFSLMDLVFAARLAPCRSNPKSLFGAAYDIYDSGLQSVLCFAALALASVVHTVPKQRPFGMLTWILRVSMFLLLIRYAWKFASSWEESGFRKC